MSYSGFALGALLILLTGCGAASSPSASPAFTPQAQCERDGAVWHASINYCEYQSPGTITR